MKRLRFDGIARPAAAPAAAPASVASPRGTKPLDGAEAVAGAGRTRGGPVERVRSIVSRLVAYIAPTRAVSSGLTQGALREELQSILETVERGGSRADRAAAWALRHELRKLGRLEGQINALMKG